MGALGADVRDMLDLGKHAFTEAFERERMDAPQHFPVGFRNGACHGADSVVIAGGFYFSRSAHLVNKFQALLVDDQLNRLPVVDSGFDAGLQGTRDQGVSAASRALVASFATLKFAVIGSVIR